jgi:HEAT repeat protein
MSDLREEEKSEEPKEEKSFFGVIIHSFFVVPFLIAVFSILLFVAVRILTIEQHTMYDYLNEIKTGGLTKRWQAAFELSKMVVQQENIPTKDRFIAELISAFEHSRHDDNRVRQYLALTMGRVGDQRFITPLTMALKEEREENLYAVIYALGMLRDKKIGASLYPYLKHPNSRVRLVSVMALGNLADDHSLSLLREALYDPEPNVQWDAAIALAKMGDASGKDILLRLLDRLYLSRFSEVDLYEQNHIMLVTIEAAARLNDPELNDVIKKLAHDDQNMNIRQTAMSLKN